MVFTLVLCVAWYDPDIKPGRRTGARQMKEMDRIDLTTGRRQEAWV